MAYVDDRVDELRRLLNQWDFIGVFDPETNTDEYDCMIAPLLTELANGADTGQVQQFLHDEITGHFGMSLAVDGLCNASGRVRTEGALSMSGSSIDALLAAGQVALRESRFVEALESYERVLDHHQPDAWWECSDACEAALRGLAVVGDGVEVQPERARRFLATALPHASTSSQIFLDAARVYLRIGEVGQVLSMLWKARAHNVHREVAAVLNEPAFWCDARHGTIMRCYDDQTAVGISGNRWVRGSVEPKLCEEFANESEAIAAFDEMEVQKLKAGEVITNFWLWHPDRPDR